MSSAGPQPGPDPTTILLVGAHSVLRAGLRALLEAEPDLRVLAECATAAEVWHRLAESPVDVLVLEAAVPGGVAPAAVRAALDGASGPRPGLVVLGPDDELVLPATVRAVAPPRDGWSARAVGAAPGPVRRLRGPDDLSDRETEVLGLIALGHTNTAIAERLFLSVRTVESHRAHIQQKTGLGSRAELVAYARRHGFA